MIFLRNKVMQPKSILIIDDDIDDCQIFCEAIKEVASDAKCVSIVDSDKALQHLAKATAELPDLIFLDINMPLMNGKECLSALKRNQKLKHIPVVMYSTTFNPTEIKTYYSLGAQDFIVKPNEYTRLVKELSKVLEKNT
jgi:CheY-like chemotaxis protein